jgi:adenylate cyclase
MNAGGIQASTLRLVDRLAELGARPEDPPDERLRAGALIVAAVLITVLAFVWVGTYVAEGYLVSAAIPAVYQVVTVAGLIVLARTKRFDLFRTMQLVLFLVLPGLLQASLGGFVASSGMILWSIMTPLAALALLGVRASVPWLVAFLAVVLVLGLADARFTLTPVELSSGVVVAFFVLNIFGVMLGSFVLLAYFVHQRELAHAALERERERSERLLLNVLPASIAEQLKRDQGVIAERHDDVTVLFADIVGFTELARGMDADELVGLLDEIFAAFDSLVEAEGLEKIKTIGDSYMAVGGLPEPLADHVAAVARTAVAMRREVAAIASRRGIGEALAIRVGIDTGPVVAGVIGRRKFIYDLWGDTVNIASRMESHGLPGAIHITGRTVKRLPGAFLTRPRGSIEIKGMGPMETFFLEEVEDRFG